MNSPHTWCFFTKFVCRYDQLNEAKARHQRCVDVLRKSNKVYFSSEEAYQAGHSEPAFNLLYSEIISPGKGSNPHNEEEYSLFIFTTIVEVPEVPDADGDEVRIVSAKLEIDFETGVPAKFPSRTRGIRVSQTGREIDGCIYQ